MGSQCLIDKKMKKKNYCGMELSARREISHFLVSLFVCDMETELKANLAHVHR
jgi:hypothetical protein